MKDGVTTLITPASRHGVSEHMQSQRRISDEDNRCEARTCALERFSDARRSGLLKWPKHTEEDDGA